MLVATGVLEKDGATSGKEVKEGSNTSYRSIEGASSTTLGSRGKGRLTIIIETRLKLKDM